jgi:uncharacterized protein
MIPVVRNLFIYPVKSLGGISLQQVQVTDRGFQHDRRWMLVDEQGIFLSQRERPAMAALQVELSATGLQIHRSTAPGNTLLVPFIPDNSEPVTVEIWGRHCEALPVSEEADAWFSRELNTRCRLVYMPESTRLSIHEKYHPSGITSFSDGYPILMVSEASLDLLNQRAGVSLEMARFRPNLVISGCAAHDEDRMRQFSINGIRMTGVKPSARCVITTIDPQTLKKGKEPLQTLSAYRKLDNNIYFGENVVAEETGVVRVGDEVRVREWKKGLEV